MSEELKAKLKQVWEDAFNQGNLDALDELVGSSYVRHQPPGPDVFGRDGLKNYVRNVRTSFPDGQLRFSKIIVEGDWSAMLWTYEGTQTGVSPNTGAQPTGKHATQQGCTMARAEGCKIVEEWVLADLLGFMQQLGVIPKLG